MHTSEPTRTSNTAATSHRDLGALDTPSLILDRRILARNLARMSRRVKELGIVLRPHMKTAKSSQVAALAEAAGQVSGITVSTLKEAEYFANQGCRDIFYAVAIAPQKLARAAAVLRQGAHLIIAIDGAAAAKEAAIQGVRLGVTFPVAIEIDCGEGRSGLTPESAELLTIANILTGKGAALIGVFTHAGHSYAGRTAEAHARVAEAEREAVVRAATRLREAGHECAMVSVGSTPTILYAHSLPGVSEARCGVYMFNDLFQAGIGSCVHQDIAISVLTTVIGCQPEMRQLIIDAGALALSKDRSTKKLQPGSDAGYGLVADLDGRILPGMAVRKVNQEHGLIVVSGEVDMKHFPIGTRFRILPNHACLTAAAYDYYQVIDGSSAVVEVWPRINGW